MKTITTLLDKGSQMGYRSFETVNGRFKILFYHRTALGEVLSDQRNQRFLLQQGYSADENVEKLLDQVVDRLINHEVPHVIGLLLGYPLKDVMGFMGHPSLKLTKVEGWRVYGNPKPSDERYAKIMEARKKYCANWCSKTHAQSFKKLLVITLISSIAFVRAPMASVNFRGIHKMHGKLYPYS